jgi:hypothetical protein
VSKAIESRRPYILLLPLLAGHSDIDIKEVVDGVVEEVFFAAVVVAGVFGLADAAKAGTALARGQTFLLCSHPLVDVSAFIMLEAHFKVRSLLCLFRSRRCPRVVFLLLLPPVIVAVLVAILGDFDGRAFAAKAGAVVVVAATAAHFYGLVRQVARVFFILLPLVRPPDLKEVVNCSHPAPLVVIGNIGPHLHLHQGRLPGECAVVVVTATEGGKPMGDDGRVDVSA